MKGARLFAAGVLGLCALAVSGANPTRPVFDPTLPALGTQFHQLPAGKGKSLVEGTCLRCHSAEMLAQQRLTEKQWTGEVEKMTRWGAEVKDAEKADVIAYLSKHFGPDNRFKPYRTRPVGY